MIVCWWCWASNSWNISDRYSCSHHCDFRYILKAATTQQVRCNAVSIILGCSFVYSFVYLFTRLFVYFVVFVCVFLVWKCWLFTLNNPFNTGLLLSSSFCKSLFWLTNYRIYLFKYHYVCIMCNRIKLCSIEIGRWNSLAYTIAKIWRNFSTFNLFAYYFRLKQW